MASFADQFVIAEQSAPQIGCAEGAGFRYHLDAIPATALKRRTRQSWDDPAGHLERPRIERKAQRAQGLAASDDQRTRRRERSRQLAHRAGDAPCSLMTG